MASKHGLGRGLKALMEEVPTLDEQKPAASQSQAGIRTVPLGKIARNPFQPRQNFPKEAMDELVRSVTERGVVQPLLVREKGDKYELIAGERRLRAAELAAIAAVPIIVVKATDQEMLEIALIENLQRADLNAIEEAGGYRTLAEKFSMTQEQIAQRVGKARASVANAMRLLDLPAEVGQLVVEGKLSPGHAKVLLGLEIPEEQILIAKRIVAEGMSVRDAEKLVEGRKRTPRKPRAKRDDIPRSHLLHLCEVLQRHLGTPVRIAPCRTLANGKKVKGRIEVDYFSPDDLDRVLELLGISLD